MDKRTLLFVGFMALAFFGVNYYFAPQETPRQQQVAAKPSQESSNSFTPTPASKPTTEKAAEQFYVLQNETQQLVFSNYGGALAEINLPFSSENDTLSVVRPIGFDRDMADKYPYNAHFPAHPYLTPGETTPKENSQIGGYYPLLRRSLTLAKNGKETTVSPQYYALNIVSDYPDTAETVYEVKEFDANHIVFESVQAYRRITKTFTLPTQPEKEKQSPYILDLSVQIEGDSRGLWVTSGVPEVELISGSPAPTVQYYLSRQGKGEVDKIDLPKERENVSVTSFTPNWISNSNGYLGMILDAKGEAAPGYRVQSVSGTSLPTRLVAIDPKYAPYQAADYPGYNTLLPLRSTGGTTNLRFFAGPFQDDILATIDTTYADPATGYNPNYVGVITFHGWFSFISEPFAKLLFILMNLFHNLTNSWAFSIILLTVALRIMLFPLNAWSFKSMRRMQQLSPEISAIQAKYKNDQRKAQMEIMNLYRTRKVNPFTGCFPLLIQMPFLIGMFDLLKSTFELRGASFIPGWIDNLTAPDVLFSWNYPIPFIGTEFHLLPILLGVVMFIQQKLSSTVPKDPSLMTDQQRQQRFMGNIMVLVFTVMFYHFPSGLNLYWLSSMLLGILQQWYTNRTTPKYDPSKPVVLPAPAKASKRG